MLYDIGIPEVKVIARYVSTDNRSIRYDAKPASGTANPAGTMGYFVPFSMRKKYEPYSGELIDYLQIYLECNSHPEESFSRRIQKYYQELKVKNL